MLVGFPRDRARNGEGSARDVRRVNPVNVTGCSTSVQDMATIAVLGTGVMGAPMARNLARAGHEVRAWNRSPDKAAPVARRRRRRARRPRGRRGGRRRRADHAGRRRRGARRRAAGEPGRGADLVAGLHHRDRRDRAVRRRSRRRPAPSLVDAPVLGTQACRPRRASSWSSPPGPTRRSTRCAPLFDAVGQRTMRLGPGGGRHTPEARGQHVGPGRDAGHGRDDRDRPSAGPRSRAGSSTPSRAARSTSRTSA